MNKEKQIIKEFETNYTCEWRWKREAHLKPSAGDFLLQALKSQKKDIAEKIEKIRGNTIGCGDVLDDLKNLITKEDITDLILKK